MWLDNKRFEIHFVEISGEKLSADKSEIGEFTTKLQKQLKKRVLHLFNYTTHMKWVWIGNSSQPDMCQCMRDKKAERTLNFNAMHKCIRQPQAQIASCWKINNSCAFKNIKLETLPVVYIAQICAWVSREIFRQWYLYNFIPEVKCSLKQNNQL